MPNETGAAGRTGLPTGLDPGDLDRVDRILLGACAAIWLVALGAGVAAIVALTDLGRGHHEPSGEPGTPWLLYTVIGVSAAVIAGAVPLLLRARREAMADSGSPGTGTVRTSPGQPQWPIRGTEAPTEKLRVSAPAADQLWLRFALVIACAMGIAMVAIGISTYLMAVGSDGAAWAGYSLAGLVTLAMPAIPWFYLHELRELVPASEE